MTTLAKLESNRANAQQSTGPKTPEGKAASAQNNFRHGLAGTFRILPWESQEEFNELFNALREEHAPSTPTETLLVESLAQHFWFAQRAMRLQERALHTNFQDPAEEKRFSLYLRYQTTHERAFQQCLNQLLKLRAEKRKAEFGFESQKRKETEQAQRKRLGEARHQRAEAEHARREAAEKRKQELHNLNLLLAEAKVDHQHVLTLNVQHTMHAAAVEGNRPLAVEKAA